MKFLLDENLSPKLAELLHAAGHDAVHVRDIGLSSATDEQVIAAATAADRVLISADTDFGTLLARSHAGRPSFVLIRRAAGRRAAEQATLILDNLPAIEHDLDAGAITVLSDPRYAFDGFRSATEPLDQSVRAA
jgi:predicted nuclease of predicted toxin-antitoxin system